MRCDKCRWSYPERLLSQMMVGGRYTKPICGICALAIQNEVAGTNRQQFHGEMAEMNRVEAVDWWNCHSEAAPPRKRS